MPYIVTFLTRKGTRLASRKSQIFWQYLKLATGGRPGAGTARETCIGVEKDKERERKGHQQ